MEKTEFTCARCAETVLKNDGCPLNQMLQPYFQKYACWFKPSEIIFRESLLAEKIFFVLMGKLELIKENSNKIYTIDEIDSGAFCGHEAIFPYGYYLTSCRVSRQQRARVSVIPRDVFMRVFEMCPMCSMSLMDDIWKKINQIEEKINGMAYLKDLAA